MIAMAAYAPLTTLDRHEHPTSMAFSKQSRTDGTEVAVFCAMRSEQVDNPGVIARPPLIYLGFLITGIILERVWPAVFAAQPFGGISRFVAAAALVGIGAATLASR